MLSQKPGNGLESEWIINFTPLDTAVHVREYEGG
jgi:hypothetical protein